MIGLDTDNGQALLKEATVVNEGMIKNFSNQVNRKYSGPASLALLMNALHIKLQSATNVQQLTVTEDEVLHQPNAASFVKTLNVEE